MKQDNPYKPDFRNSKVGDACYHIYDGIVKILEIGVVPEFPISAGINMFETYTYDGFFLISDDHPCLFNSHDQFINYHRWESIHQCDDIIL